MNKILPILTGLIASLLIIWTLSADAATFPLPKNGNNVVGQIKTILAEDGDTFHDIAQKYDIGYYQLVEANPTINPNKIPVGTLIIIPSQYILPNTPHEGIVINLAELRGFYYPPGKDEVFTFPVGIGRQGWNTPKGVTKIIQKQAHPTWVVPESIRKWRAEQGGDLPKVVPPGPDNPLGDYAMRLGWYTYLMHGTNEPSGVGMRSSSGCIRLYPDDIDKLFHMVKVGTRVQVVDEPYKIGYLDNKLYLEAHVPLEENYDKYEDSFKPLIAVIDKDVNTKQYNINWGLAEQVSVDHPGLPIIIGSKDTPDQKAS